MLPVSNQNVVCAAVGSHGLDRPVRDRGSVRSANLGQNELSTVMAIAQR